MSRVHREPKRTGPAGMSAAGPSRPARGVLGIRRRRLFFLRRGERGQAILEFAMVLPLLTFLVLALILFGKALWVYIDLTHAANEGARVASVDVCDASNPSVLQCPSGTTLASYLTSEYALPSGAHVAICYPTGTRQIGDPVEIEVYTSASWVPLIGGSLGSIKAVATMRLEQSTVNNPMLDATPGGCNQ